MNLQIKIILLFLRFNNQFYTVESYMILHKELINYF